MILLQSDEQLLRDCRQDVTRGSGPGGQKRNKTNNAVRLTHVPTGIFATATESRSLEENKLYAMRRLRLKIACEIRSPVDLTTFEPPEYFLEVRRDQRIEMSHRHTLYSAVCALVLDLFKASTGRPSVVAANLGVSTTSVIKLLESEPHLWTTANAMRAELGMEPLEHRH